VHTYAVWGGLGLLVWEEIDPAQTVENPKLKIYM
jgi:hypothetical protein